MSGDPREMESVFIKGFRLMVPARAKSSRGDYSIWVGKTDRGVISCWRVPFLVRLQFLFHGRIWLETLGNNQPAVALHCKETIIKKAR